jgi:hypothetical protein
LDLQKLLCQTKAKITAKLEMTISGEGLKSAEVVSEFLVRHGSQWGNDYILI